MVANKKMASPVSRWRSTTGIFNDNRISRALVFGSICLAGVVGALQTAACSNGSVQHEKAALNARTEVPPLVEVKAGPLMVPVPEGDTEVSPFKPLPASTGVPMALVPGISANVALTPSTPGPSGPTVR
jgi:hypothetical protein